MKKFVGIENLAVEERVKTLQAELRKKVKQAKKIHYQQVINELNREMIFQAMKWPTSTQKYSTPTMQKTNGLLATSKKEKRDALKQAFLTPTLQISKNGSTTWLADLDIESRDCIIEWHTCSSKEVGKAILHASNTSSGVDKAPPVIIKKAWPILANEITLLFQLYLNKRYHHTVFKIAILFTLPKLDNHPKHLPRSYYLIALLSCLRKVLERIVA